jgi:hypothetical protein
MLIGFNYTALFVVKADFVKYKTENVYVPVFEEIYPIVQNLDKRPIELSISI